MAKPNNQQKEINPKINEDLVKVPIDNNLKLVLINIVSTLLTCIVFVVVNYVLQDGLLTNKIDKLSKAGTAGEEIAEDEAEEQVQKGIIVDLGDFILNLSDVGHRKYLKVNVALELSKAADDPSDTVVKSGGGHHGAEPEDPTKLIEQRLAQYKPAIRDIVITTFSSKTSDEVMTVAGKELVKEQITNDVNALFAGEREVIRVSFGQFIIQ